MSTSFYKGLLFASLGLLFHAAYSAAEWRSYARKSEQVQSDSIPLDITLETVIGLSLAMVAVLKIGGKSTRLRILKLDTLYSCRNEPQNESKPLSLPFQALSRRFDRL